MKGKLFIIAREFFLADYILDALGDDPDIEIFHHERRQRGLGKVKKALRSFGINRRGLWSGDIYSAEYRDFIARVTPDDRVILWGVENVKDVSILSRELNTRHITSFLWNPMSRICRNHVSEIYYCRRMRAYGIEVCTFDSGDAARFGFSEVPQVYRKTDLPERNIITDVFFVGADKRRQRAIERLLRILDSEKIRYLFHVVRDKHTPAKVAPLLERCLTDRNMAYADTLAAIAGCRCIAEIVQQGQTGMSLRVIEAMFYNKKLITNNAELKRHPTYRRENIYIIDDPEQPWESVSEFLDAPLVPYGSPEYTSSHEIRTWIKRFK